MDATCCAIGSSVTRPSRSPSVKAKPELVVASAVNPSASRTRADPVSHGFGITNGSPACIARKADPLSCCLLIADMDHHLPALPAGHASLERSAGVTELVDTIDRRTELTAVDERRHLGQLIAVRFDHEVGRLDAVGRRLRDGDDPAGGTEEGGGAAQRFSAGRVEHQVDGLERVVDPPGAVIDHLVGPAIPDDVSTAWRGAPDHVRAVAPGE